jgi:hypothetical protein
MMRVRLSDDGFGVHSAQPVDVPWVDVVRIRSYKYDLFAVDEICLCFELADGRFIEVSEEWDRYAALTEAMAVALPGVNADWFTQTMWPAFAPCETVVFERKSTACLASKR